MDADELALFTGVTDAERLASLREQLWLLARVREDVQVHGQILRTLVTDNPGYQWRSAAERGYAAQVAELGSDLELAGRDLEAACDAAREELARSNRVE
ncbi:hypothetical protein GCM10022381_21200 [Leifsonia kafniensis]|uniref:Uncharacterized protein n=1 Tax=Leifsonia kafniensis TaxID=475957 RepID=A0ABP7KKA3_9MICO